MTNILAFVTIAAVLVITPGSDTMLVIRSVISQGKRAGLLTIAGITLGCIVHATLSALGLSAVLAASTRAFDILKIAGASYLVMLGLQGLWTAASGSGATKVREPGGPVGDTALSASFRDGLVTNILNPKVAIFYLAFVPQFIDSTKGIVVSYALLVGVHILFGALWLSTLTFALDRMRVCLTRRSTKRVLDGLTGAALVGLGVRLAVAHR